mmetsp:Transcript_10341/g.22165  ORF Transcript_10341/g.22165 Transcript_10341/m.22165 type:complete len:175 (-) Transcript_10341:171-695(-)|eukprot:CAMPEP_0171439232 /NCGR_PEP_ID=MMETSP0881-20121228/19977_1 /TAXON_ID=67004 /ORGANISM="Thalassiosira weissflogii, Strain CCMP1336" /LENGTH=174 /DNA_ID=CAMNT_0011961353 /DNA_START=221 /DNA_END=745 /DNA_ORIENTATION=+
MVRTSFILACASVAVQDSAAFSSKSIQNHSRNSGIHHQRVSQLKCSTTSTSSNRPALDDAQTLIEKKTNDSNIKSGNKRHTTKKTVHEQVPNDWLLKLFDDSKNTRGYISRCLTQVVGLSESEAFYTMENAHMSGSATVGVFREEMAECYKEGLLKSGIDCDIFPVESSNYGME